MKIVNVVVLSCFFFLLPLLGAVWFYEPAFATTERAAGSGFLEWGNAITGFLMSLWIACAAYVAISLIVSRRFREQLLKRMTRMKERDEREEMIVGRSARNVFLFNIALLIVLFLFNLIHAEIIKLPPDAMIQGKGHVLSLGLNASPIAQRLAPAPDAETPGTTIVRYGFPLSVSGVLMVLLCANLGAFFVYARREERR